MNFIGGKVLHFLVQLYWEGKRMERAMDFLTANGIGGCLCFTAFRDMTTADMS